MAQKFVDVSLKDEKEDYELGDGAALDLTGDIRVVYDDAIEPAKLYTVLTQVRNRLLEGNIPDAE